MSRQKKCHIEDDYFLRSFVFCYQRATWYVFVLTEHSHVIAWGWDSNVICSLIKHVFQNTKLNQPGETKYVHVINNSFKHD